MAPYCVAAQGYLANFPPTKGTRVTGEWSATYLQCWCCAPAAKAALPSARIIVILRDPIERAHSRFKEQVRLLSSPFFFFLIPSFLCFVSSSFVMVPKEEKKRRVLDATVTRSGDEASSPLTPHVRHTAI